MDKFTRSDRHNIRRTTGLNTVNETPKGGAVYNISNRRCNLRTT